MGKDPQELSCQDVRDFLLAKKEEGLKATTLNLYNSAIRFFFRNVLHLLWDDVRVPRIRIDHKLPTVLSRRNLDILTEYYYSALIQRNPDWEYAGVYADCGISGTGTARRDEFRKMVEDADAGKIDIVLTKSIQRFAERIYGGFPE